MLVSCAVGPDFKRPDAPAIERYTDAEFPTHKDWGHSTWEEGVRLADAADVKTLVIFHHDPGHDDDFMDQVAAEAAAARPGTIVAQEGLVLRP